MFEVTSATEIEASPDAVWGVLTDLEKFGAWNPFIRQARGSTELGGEVHVRVRPSLGVPLAFHARITEREPAKHLRWYGRLLADWLASGDHTFDVERVDERTTRFVQRERFGGVLPWLARRLVVREAYRGFTAMNRALAERVRSLR
jgi:hypothetical protein